MCYTEGCVRNTWRPHLEETRQSWCNWSSRHIRRSAAQKQVWPVTLKRRNQVLHRFQLLQCPEPAGGSYWLMLYFLLPIESTEGNSMKQLHPPNPSCTLWLQMMSPAQGGSTPIWDIPASFLYSGLKRSRSSHLCWCHTQQPDSFGRFSCP